MSVYFCHSCGRSYPRYKLNEVEAYRYICDNCIATEVNSGNLARVVRNVIQLLRSKGFDDILYDNATVKLVSKAELRAIVPGCDNPMGVHQRENCIVTDRGLKDVTETIYVLNHLTEIEFRQVIAHELLHSWQTRNNLQSLFQDDELSCKMTEGFAQMGSYLVFSTVLKHHESDYVRRRIDSLFNDDDPFYGKAFQSIYQQFSVHPGSELERWYYIIKCARRCELNV